MPTQPKKNWRSVEINLPNDICTSLAKAAKVSGFTEEELLRAILALGLVKEPKPEVPVARLMHVYEEMDVSALEDLLTAMMTTVEDGLLQSGFVPNQDYNRKDLLNFAFPLVMKVWDKGNTTFAASRKVHKNESLL